MLDLAYRRLLFSPVEKQLVLITEVFVKLPEEQLFHFNSSLSFDSVICLADLHPLSIVFEV